MNGPYETERQARETPAVQAVYTHFHALPRDRKFGGMDEPNRLMIEQACQSAGVELGAYDRRIIAWLAGFEPQTCAVIAGLITRAAPATRRPARRDRHPRLSDAETRTVLSALDTAADCYRDRAGICGDCDGEPAGELCGACEYRLQAASEYDTLAEELRGQL